MSYDVAVVGSGDDYLDGTTSARAQVSGPTISTALAAVVIAADTVFEQYHKEIVAFMDSVRSFQKYECCDWLERRKKHDRDSRLFKRLVFLRPIFFRRIMFSAAGYLPWRIRRKRKGR